MNSLRLAHLVRLSVSACLLFSIVSSAQAKETTIDAAPFAGKKIRLDGMLSEWPELSVLSERISGAGQKDDPRALGTVGYDEKNLYVGMRIKDAKLTRTAGFGKKEDHAVLHLAFPAGSGFKNYQVRLYPGVPGKSAGTVKRAGGAAAAGAKIVEAPAQGGLTFEASIPWSTFAPASRVRSGLRGTLVYFDYDSPGKLSAAVGTSKKQGSSAPMLTLEAEYSLYQGLVKPKGLNRKADKELFGNVVGDRMLERVAIYDRYLAITGWNYRQGKEFYFQDLQVLGRENLKRFELRDLTQDGHDDIVIQRRVGSSGDAREYLEVWHFRASDDGPQLIFQHEVAVVDGVQSIENNVTIKRVKGDPYIIVSQGKHSNLEPASWDREPAGGTTFPMLLPWQGVKSKSYTWKSGKFELASEESWKPKLAGPKRGTRMWSGTKPPAGAVTDSATSVAPPPRAPTAEEKMDSVYGLYRNDRGVKKEKPRFDFVTNVAADDVNERVLVHGKDLVVFGKNFKSGNSYVFTTIGVKNAADVLDVTARDVTGDGRAEVIVRGVINAQASKQLGGDVVTRHALFIYQVDQNEVRRIFAAETGRSVGDKTILGHVRFVPAGRALEIQLSSGRALGWDKESYPFPQDPAPYGGLEPLLLPWSDMSERSYKFQGSEFKQL